MGYALLDTVLRRSGLPIWPQNVCPVLDVCRFRFQFGFVALFSVAFPIVPLLSLLMSLANLRILARHVLETSQVSLPPPKLKAFAHLSKLISTRNALSCSFPVRFGPGKCFDFVVYVPMPLLRALVLTARMVLPAAAV